MPPLTSDTCLQYSQSFSTCPRTGPTWCTAALSAINAQSNRVSHVNSIELVWLCFSAHIPRHIPCTKHSSALTDSKAKTLGSIFGKFNISAAMCRTGNLKTGKSQNHQFSGNKSSGKYTRYTVHNCYRKCFLKIEIRLNNFYFFRAHNDTYFWTTI